MGARKLAIVMIGLSFFACTRSNPDAHAPIRIAIESEPTSLDPRMAMDAYSAKVNELLYRGLFAYDDAMALVPDLVAAYEILSLTRFRFTLKPDLLFNDGSPLTADDVAYTYLSVLDPLRKSPLREGFKMLESVSVLSPTEFEMRLKHPYAPFLNRLTLGIVPERHGDRPDFARHPVGSGAFQLLEWRHGQYLHLQRYVDTNAERVAPDIQFWILPDENLRILELLHGRIDLVQNGISPILLPAVERSKDVVVDKANGINLAYMGFQLQDPILSKRGVREAVASAVDREKLVRLQLRGSARLSNSPLSPQNWAYASGLVSGAFGPRYDPDRAKALLDAAGFPDPDGDGPLPRFHLVYKTSVQKDRVEMALLIAEFLRAVGIEVSVESREWATFFQDIQQGRFQLFSLTWVGITDPDILYYMFHSESAPPKGGNRGHYSSPRVDAALEKARVTYDLDERKRLYGEVQGRIAADYPYVLLWYEDNIAVRRRDLCGYRLRPNASFRGVKDVYRGTCTP